MNTASRIWIAQDPDGEITIWGAEPTPEYDWCWTDESQTELPVVVHAQTDIAAVREFEIRPVGPPLIYCPGCNGMKGGWSGPDDEWEDCAQCAGKGVICEEAE